MKKTIITLFTFTLFLSQLAFIIPNSEKFSLTIKVKNLRNSKGVVQFALYNKVGSIPDEEYENYYKMQSVEIVDSSASIKFKNIPSGKYAVNILHDENKNGKIDKGFILPIEGIGFSNFQSISLTSRPIFSKASFELIENKKISIKVIYM